jgi:hypothetical protein
MGSVRPEAFDKTVGAEFPALHAELVACFKDTVDHPIADALKSDGADEDIESAPQGRWKTRGCSDLCNLNADCDRPRNGRSVYQDVGLSASFGCKDKVGAVDRYEQTVRCVFLCHGQRGDQPTQFGRYLRKRPKQTCEQSIPTSCRKIARGRFLQRPAPCFFAAGRPALPTTGCWPLWPVLASEHSLRPCGKHRSFVASLPECPGHVDVRGRITCTGRGRRAFRPPPLTFQRLEDSYLGSTF